MEQRQDPRALSGHKRLVPRRAGPARLPEPLADPRRAVRRAPTNPRIAPAARLAALTLAGVGLAWIAATWAGDALGWSVRVRALFDLLALAGFGFALYLTWQVWRLRRADKGQG